MVLLVRALALAFALTSTACGSESASGRPVAAPGTPRPIAVVSPRAYGNGAAAEEPEEICAIDPHACPKREAEQGTRLGKHRAAEAKSKAQVRRDDSPEIQLTGPLASAPAVSGSDGDYGYEAKSAAADGPRVPAPDAIPVKPLRADHAEAFDVEAKVQLQVSAIESARHQLIALVAAFDGQVLNEAVEDGQWTKGASLSIRVSSGRVHAFLERLRGIGKVLSSSVETQEVSRALGDAAIVEHNLAEAIQRYQELLAKAANVAEATAVEGELGRVRTELARVRGDLEWMRDRVARSTVYVTLGLAPSAAEFAPKAKLYPGLRAATLIDVPPKTFASHASTYAGGAMSLAWERMVDFDIALYNDLGRVSGAAVEFYSVTLGAAMYSDYLGGGKRRHFNPYIGFRAGYAHAPSQDLFPLGATLGLDLYKSDVVLFGVEARNYVLFGRKQGPDYAFEPSLGLNVAY